jgi:hypothetical protein
MAFSTTAPVKLGAHVSVTVVSSITVVSTVSAIVIRHQWRTEISPMMTMVMMVRVAAAAVAATSLSSARTDIESKAIHVLTLSGSPNKLGRQ